MCDKLIAGQTAPRIIIYDKGSQTIFTYCLRVSIKFVRILCNVHARTHTYTHIHIVFWRNVVSCSNVHSAYGYAVCSRVSKSSSRLQLDASSSQYVPTFHSREAFVQIIATCRAINSCCVSLRFAALRRSSPSAFTCGKHGKKFAACTYVRAKLALARHRREISQPPPTTMTRTTTNS